MQQNTDIHLAVLAVIFDAILRSAAVMFTVGLFANTDDDKINDKPINNANNFFLMFSPNRFFAT